MATDAGPARPRASTPRGSRRRDALVAAATALLEEQGFDALSHRAVAARAGLPLAATTYYFASRDDLVEPALRRLGTAFVGRARDLVAALPEAPRPAHAVAADAVAVVAGPEDEVDAARLLTFYERYLQAGRHERWRGIVTSWTDDLVALVTEVLRRADLPHDDQLARLVVATIDGQLLALLVEGRPDARARAAAGLARFLGAIPPTPDEPSADE